MEKTAMETSMESKKVGSKESIYIVAPNTVDHGHVLVNARNLAQSMECTVIVQFQATQHKDEETIFFTVEHTIYWSPVWKCAIPVSVEIIRNSDLAPQKGLDN